jgi:hypothetical protein
MPRLKAYYSYLLKEITLKRISPGLPIILPTYNLEPIKLGSSIEVYILYLLPLSDKNVFTSSYIRTELFITRVLRFV